LKVLAVFFYHLNKLPVSAASAVQSQSRVTSAIAIYQIDSFPLAIESFVQPKSLNNSRWKKLIER
jgi:hypothetical protein